MVNVQQQGDVQLHTNIQVMIPISNTSCNGRITGFMMSLSQEQNGSDYLRFEVWSPTTISSEVYEMTAEYVLAEHDIKDMGKYHFANVSFVENETIKFEKGIILLVSIYHLIHVILYRVLILQDIVIILALKTFQGTI